MAREERGGRHGGSEGQERRVSAGGLQERATGEEGAARAEVRASSECIGTGGYHEESVASGRCVPSVETLF